MSTHEYAHFDDTAFDPQASYSFDDFNDKSMQDMPVSTTVHSGKRDIATMFDTSDYTDFPTYQHMGGSNLRGNIVPLPLQDARSPMTQPSVSAMIGSGEGHQLESGAMKRFGQITPPEDNRAVCSKPSSLGNSSIDKSGRARNAANQRHSKRGRHDSKDVAAEQSGEEESVGGEKKERYREKNRQAAAKCREKKKKNTEELDKTYKIVAAENAARKQEVRMLRDEFCSIRELALQHAPEQCGCSSLHAFNMQQAVKEASHMARTMGDVPLMETASTGHYGSDVTSPDSTGTSTHAPTFPGPAIDFEYAPADIDFR